MADTTDAGLPAGTILARVRVRDVMSAPLVSCDPDVPLAEVAALMARHGIHSVVVRSEAGARERDPRPWGIITGLDLAGAVPFDEADLTAGRVAGTPPVTIDPDDALGRCALLMAEHAVTHAIVAEDPGEPIGIVSVLDLARALVLPDHDEDAPAAPGAPGARPGDRLVISGHHLGEPSRDAEILEARGPAGGPPYLVRWEDSGRMSLFYPGSDARVERLGAGA